MTRPSEPGVDVIGEHGRLCGEGGVNQRVIRRAVILPSESKSPLAQPTL